MDALPLDAVPLFSPEKIALPEIPDMYLNPGPRHSIDSLPPPPSSISRNDSSASLLDLPPAPPGDDGREAVGTQKQQQQQQQQQIPRGDVDAEHPSKNNGELFAPSAEHSDRSSSPLPPPALARLSLCGELELPPPPEELADAPPVHDAQVRIAPASNAPPPPPLPPASFFAFGGPSAAKPQGDATPSESPMPARSSPLLEPALQGKDSPLPPPPPGEHSVPKGK